MNEHLKKGMRDLANAKIKELQKRRLHMEGELERTMPASMQAGQLNCAIALNELSETIVLLMMGGTI